MTGTIAIRGPAREETLDAWGGQIQVRVKIGGSGPPLVYFHSAGGLYWDAFLDRLAQTHTVYAPEMPGTTVGDPYAIHKLETWWDLLLVYEEVVRKLGLVGAPAIGQSMGGMTVCDLASNFTGLFARLVALAPVGLWRDDAPLALADLYSAPPEKVPGYLFLDPSLPAAQAMFAQPADPGEAPAHIAHAVWTPGCTAKFLWPIPDLGLARRLHRISMPALIAWGREDRPVPVAYAEEFAGRIPGARVSILERCGPIAQMEQLHQTFRLVNGFLGE
jgi:pimeloyl-ACP methyl ester carboxylesterase